MTKSLWVNEELGTHFPECRTLKDIITRLESDFSSKGEVICEIRVNGMILSEADECKFAENAVNGIQEIAIRSNRPGDLICEALDSALVFIPDLDKCCLRAAEVFRGPDQNQAQRMFHEALEGCQWLIDTIIHIRGAASGIHAPIKFPERWYEAEKVIAKVITEVNEAYTNHDYVLVADLLEYELTTALTIWKEALAIERDSRR